MSDNWITLIPEDPRFRPGDKEAEVALNIFKELAPEADEIKIINTEGISFYDCGASFESVSCPSCKKELNIEKWHEFMEGDKYKSGFKLQSYQLPCCNANHNLNELICYWNQGFSVFALEAMNPNIGELGAETIGKFESVLGSKLCVIYQHI